MSDICKVYQNFLKYKGSDDVTKHRDEQRRENYLARAMKIKGNWAKDKYSPNSLAINLLWQ